MTGAPDTAVKTDSILERLVAIVAESDYDNLAPEVIHAAKRSLIDALGCSYGAFDSEPATIARKMAALAEVPKGAAVIGSKVRTTADLAAFANGVMIRYLDFNDAFMSEGGGGHPSDYDAAALAAAQAANAGGRQVIAGIAAAYELHARLTDATRFGTDKWDYVTLGVTAATGAAAKAMDLSSSATAHAISLAVVGNVALLESRRGSVSMWKGCASANACRNGVFAASIAGQGLTGPPRPFEGRNGFIRMVSGPLDAADLAPSEPGILRCHFKRFPAGFFSQTAIDAALQLRDLLPSLEAIEAVQIGTFPFAMQAMGGPEKWHPKTRETADHSLPYVVASALLHGDLTMRHFDEAHLRDPRAGALMDRIKVDVDPESVERFPGDALNRVTITLADGSVHTAAVAHHRGHRLNPMSDIEIEAKFRSQAEPWIGGDRAGRLLDALWKLEQLTDLDSLTELTAVEAGRP